MKNLFKFGRAAFLLCSGFIFSVSLLSADQGGIAERAGDLKVNEADYATHCGHRVGCERGKRGRTGATGATGATGQAATFLTASTSRVGTGVAGLAIGAPFLFATPIVADENIGYADGIFTIVIPGRYHISVAYNISSVNASAELFVNEASVLTIANTEATSGTGALIPTTFDLDLEAGDIVRLINQAAVAVTTPRIDSAGRSTLIEMHRIGDSPAQPS